MTKISLLKSKILFGFILSAVTSLAMAVTDPVVMLDTVTKNVLKELREHHDSLQTDSKQIYNLVNEHVLPYVDFTEMSRWVAGKTAWGQASEASREQFVKEFKVLVVRTYATALKSYSNEKVEFAEQEVNTERKRIQITSRIVRENNEHIRLDYRLIKNGDSWLVYDIIIEGISILQGFQAQFSDDIRLNGLEPVIAKIKDHNSKGTTK